MREERSNDEPRPDREEQHQDQDHQDLTTTDVEHEQAPDLGSGGGTTGSGGGVGDDGDRARCRLGHRRRDDRGRSRGRALRVTVPEGAAGGEKNLFASCAGRDHRFQPTPQPGRDADAGQHHEKLHREPADHGEHCHFLAAGPEHGDDDPGE